MRRLLLSLLLASAAATPALAGPNDDNSDRRANRAEHQQVREERQQAREQRATMRDRLQSGGQARYGGGASGGQPQPEANAGGGQQPVAHPDRPNGPRQGYAGRRPGQSLEPTGSEGAQSNPQTYVAPGARTVSNPFAGRTVREDRTERRRQAVDDGQQTRELRQRAVTNDALRRSDRPLPNVLRRSTGAPLVSNTPRPGTQPPLRTERRRHDRADWNTNWRHDHRYDWSDWRRRHRSTFHLGFYYDPFGWGYQRYSIGWRLWPSYYGSSFWINDPWQYRLPYAPPGYRWVRYYDDALLVDTWTGEVVDVIYSFFW